MQMVSAIRVEVRRGGIDGDRNLRSGTEPCRGNCPGQDIEGCFVVRQARPPSTFVRDAGQDVAFRFEKLASSAMNRHGGVQRIGIGRESVRRGEEILKFEIAARVESARQDIDHRQRDGGCARACQAPPQRDSLGRGGGARHRAGDSQDCVGAKPGLVRRAIQLDHPAVHGHLVLRAHTLQRRRDQPVHGAGRRAHTPIGVP